MVGQCCENGSGKKGGCPVGNGRGNTKPYLPVWRCTCRLRSIGTTRSERLRVCALNADFAGCGKPAQGNDRALSQTTTRHEPTTEYLEKFGPFDMTISGGGWMNPGAVQY